MDLLIAEAKKRDMHILMDLVVNHCSDEHEWFKKACEDPDGEYGKYFYIEDCPNGKLPCGCSSCITSFCIAIYNCLYFSIRLHDGAAHTNLFQK